VSPKVTDEGYIQNLPNSILLFDTLGKYSKFPQKIKATDNESMAPDLSII